MDIRSTAERNYTVRITLVDDWVIYKCQHKEISHPMSKWQGYDQTRVCPNCGAYPAQMKIGRRSSPLIMFVILTAVVVSSSILSVDIISQVLRGSIPRLSTIFFLLSIIGMLLFNKKFKEELVAYSETLLDYINQRQDFSAASTDQENEWVVYNLHCQNCGHKWKIWEKAEKNGPS